MGKTSTWGVIARTRFAVGFGVICEDLSSALKSRRQSPPAVRSRPQRKAVLLAFASTLCSAALLISPAVSEAASPTVKLGSGTLVDPGQAFTYYNNHGGSVSGPAPTKRDPLIQELARSLGYDIDKIFTHVRDHVEFTPLYGLQKGARGVALDGYGTAFDQAQFLVEMLRESDAATANTSAPTAYDPQYVLGRITVSGADFESWFGVADAAAAMRVLADGGIPATVTGTGSNFSVTMSHVWVLATVKSQDGSSAVYAFDPSFKRHSVIAGLSSLPTAMSYNLASGVPTYSAENLLAEGVSGATINTSQEIKTFNASSFRGALTAYRSSLEQYLSNPVNNLVGAKIDNIVGHRSIVAHDPSQNRLASLPYAAGTDFTWSGQIPNVFRTSFTLNLTGWSAPDTFYADEVYGKPLLFSYPSTASPYASVSGLDIVPTLHLPVGTQIGDCDRYTDSATPSATILTVSIQHPYAASASGGSTLDGTYMSRTLSKQVSWRACNSGRFLVTNDWGDLGGQTTALMRRGVEPLTYYKTSQPDFVSGPELESIASEYAGYLRLAENALGGIYQLHDLIGVAQLDNVNSELTTIVGGSNFTSNSSGVMLTTDFEAGVSANLAATGDGGAQDASHRAGLIRVGQSGLSIAESAVSRAEADGVRDVSSLTLLTQQNSVAQTPGDYPYYLATSANWNSVVRPILLANGYPSAALAILDGYISEGYSLFLPQQGNLRQQPYSVPVSTNGGTGTQTQVLLDTEDVLNFASRTVLYRPSFFAFNSTTGDGAFLIYDPRRRRVVKGGTDMTVADPSGNLVRQPDTPQAVTKDLIFDELQVNGRSGELAYTPPVDLSDGVGDFPLRLSLQRRYDPADVNDYGLGVGWKHSWRQTVTLTSDLPASLGASGGFGAASALVAIQAVYDLAGVSDDPQHLLSEAMVDQWFVDQTVNNAATVGNGLDGDETFFRRADGTYLNAQPDGAQLSQDVQPIDSIVNRRVYGGTAGYQFAGIHFTYTSKFGDIKTYSYVPDPGETLDLTQPFYIGMFTRKTFFLSSWSFPSGVVVTPSYTVDTGYDAVFLSQVQNNVGALIKNTSYSDGDFVGDTCNADGTVTSTPQPSFWTYQNSAGVSVTYNKQPGYGYQLTCSSDPNDPNSGKVITKRRRPVLQSFVDASGHIWSFSYASLVSTYDDVATVAAYDSPAGPLVALSAIYKPSLPGTPASNITLGVNGRVQRISEPTGASYQYFTSPYYFALTDPLSNTTQTTYDEYGRAIAVIDPLGHTTTRQYDARDRLTTTVHPLLDSEVRTYDVRSNLLSVADVPAPGAPAPPTVTTSAVYGEPGTINCANIFTCNKIASTTDPNNNTTTYSWYQGSSASGSYFPGALQSIVKPAVYSPRDGATLNPTTTFYYSQLPASGPKVWLLTSKTQTIDGSNTVKTTFNYDASLHVNGTTVDQATGGLNLTTCVKLDASGNVLSMTDPRANPGATASVCP